MKKLILILAICMAVGEVFAQLPIPNPRIKYSPASTPYEWFWGRYTKGLSIPTGPTAIINENSSDSLRAGRIFFESAGPGLGGTFKIWDGAQWVTVTGGGGSPGSVRFYGAGAPSIGIGANGDTYVNTTTNQEYKKEAGVWVLKVTPLPSEDLNVNVSKLD